MNYAAIKDFDVANGPGVRVSMFVSGCRNHCKGCFQPETWNFDYGAPFTDEVAESLIQAMKPDYIEGITILGGDPFEPENQEVMVDVLQMIRNTYPDKSIWCFTGYLYDEDLVAEDGKRHTEVTDEMLSYIDVLVDGPFVEDKKNLLLQFRGSENQRVIDLKKMREEDSADIIWWPVEDRSNRFV